MNTTIPFNVPHVTGGELDNIKEVMRQRHFSGDGEFTRRCREWLERQTGCVEALLTHSCTAALEMGALLMNTRPGDEIIMPSFTFVSTANAFVLRGGVPVFVDIREDTLNLDEKLIEEAITPRTIGIAPVHYAGVSCEMDTINAIAERHGLRVLEDAAQCLMASYKGRALGTLGDFGALSFHATKNVISGEGGALLLNKREDVLRGEILREKGTNRSSFFRGEVDKYTWQDVGSSYLPSELVAGFLAAQLEAAEAITRERLELWQAYHERFAALEARGVLRRPVVPAECTHNAHIYYVLLAPGIDRQHVMEELKRQGIHSVFHYVPLHSAPAGEKYCRTHGTLSRTDDLSERLLRLPLWNGMTSDQIDFITERLAALL